MNIEQYWHELVTVALLGTDRRDPPLPPPGGLADLAADNPLPTQSQRLLQQVAGCSVARRAGVLPGPAVTTVLPPGHDPRRLTPPAATGTWQLLVHRWPVLEDEWLLAVAAHGLRLSPELVPPLLARHRSDAARHARVVRAAGPLAPWMIEWYPRLVCTAKRAPTVAEVARLADLPITPDLVPLLTAPASQSAATIGGGLSTGQLGSAHRAVLVNLLARVVPASLPAIGRAIDRVDAISPSIGLAVELSDLVHLRHHMLTELEPS